MTDRQQQARSLAQRIKAGYEDFNSWKLLGEGLYCQVWEVEGFAVKIRCDWQVDRYPFFARFCRRHPELEHLPNIYYFGKLKKGRKSPYFVIMDIYQIGQVSGVDPYAIRLVAEGAIDKYLAHRLPASLWETARSVYNYRKESFSDLHPNNIMRRESCPIIMDPWA